MALSYLPQLGNWAQKGNPKSHLARSECRLAQNEVLCVRCTAEANDDSGRTNASSKGTDSIHRQFHLEHLSPHSLQRSSTHAALSLFLCKDRKTGGNSPATVRLL